MPKNSTFFTAKTLSDVLYQIKNVNDLQIVGGCTQVTDIPEKALSLSMISDLCAIENRERYVEFGCAVTLSDMLLREEYRLPAVLTSAVRTIATERVRNIATLGGNICAGGIYHTLYAPLLALNARLEIRSPAETQVIPFARFRGLAAKHIVTKVRIPLDNWDIGIFRRIGPSHAITPLSASFCFLASTQRNMISSIRVAFAGAPLFYSPELENHIIGLKLPLSEQEINNLIETARDAYADQNAGADRFIEAQFLNLLRFSLEQLS